MEVCELLVRSFRDLSPTWVPTVDAARVKVVEALEPDALSRVLLVDDRVVGWVGARHDYGSVWELHPLVVDEAMRGRGYGRALVNDVECLAAGSGALTMVLGTSDEVGRTTLSSQDLFPDVVAALRDLKPTTLDAGDHKERVTAELVSGNYFALLGVEPAAGRMITVDDDHQGRLACCV